MSHTDPMKRHDFVFLFDVTNGNPNGDPDAGNLPRTNPQTGHGLVTDVALKRKVRDYLANYRETPIFIQSQVTLNSHILKAFRDVGVQAAEVMVEDDDVQDWLEQNQSEAFEFYPEEKRLVYTGESPKVADIQQALADMLVPGEGNDALRPKLNRLARQLSQGGAKKVEPKKRMEARDRLCKDYYDIRMFGAVLSTGLNAGQVRGPMQLTFARSIDPIVVSEITITRQARTTAVRLETGPTEMGRKNIVPYGLYRAHGYFNPFFAKQTGVTEADLEVFWEALTNMFEFDHSAARGEMVARGLYVFSHDNILGNAPSHTLFDRIQVDEATGARSFRDYQDHITVEEKDPDGVTLTRLVG
ncbi:MAG: type I-C CRISPR-associated protein Cas7/Csd2 [Chloroflexi bacterium]|nr:type I-C CRISPR-associated protein Cas7/Csd2 [Chloroflexota bacterium]